MDSRLLNVVYDDPFDGNYVKYDDNEFWTSGSDAMGMQLTETLSGILPIAPTEDFHKENHSNSINIQNKVNALHYESFADQQLATGGAIEIVTVDPNTDGYDSESEDDEDTDDDEEDDSDTDLLDYERQSQCSNATFRTRTDSSSIGDYESHTSDYDDSEDDEENETNNVSLIANSQMLMTNSTTDDKMLGLHTNLGAADDFLFDSSFHKNRTLSTNTLNSDVDGLGLQIDANNFDLADFITKDDFQISSHMTASNSLQQSVKAGNVTEIGTAIKGTPPLVQVIKSKNDDSDSDSDVIVDVETVEVNEDEASSLRKASQVLKPQTMQHIQTEEEVPFVDNIKVDPSWSPVMNAKRNDTPKVEDKTSTQKPNFTRNFPLVPNKKQCDLLKGKFALGKAKTVQKTTKLKTCKNIKLENSPVKQNSTKVASNSVAIKEIATKKIGIGMGGKNLALLKHERVSISEQSSEENNTPVKIKPEVKQSPKQEKPIVTTKKIEETSTQNVQAIKRKLNLDEYKKRRCGGEQINASSLTTPSNAKFLSYKIPKLENKNSPENNNVKTTPVNTMPIKHSEAVTSIVKSLKEQKSLKGKTASDPITEAKNKVLRMQELKKAQQMRIIDSTISAKVPRVTKLLPLKEIVKDSGYLKDDNNRSENCKAVKSDYEEIIIISASCNTDISIPPFPNASIEPVNNVSRSLLKSSALLSTISNTFQKVKATDNTKLSTSSLIASIQDVVVKNTMPLDATAVCEDTKGTEKPEHHGEDKIIMHLRKDRIRKRMCSIGIQTDLQPEFPPLALPKSSIQHKSRERTRRHRKRQYRKHKDASSSSSSDSSDEESDHSNTSTISRSRENSCSSSLDRMRTYDSAIGTGGYSSRSSHKHRSSISSSYSESADRVARGRRQRRTSYTKRSATRKRSRSPYSTSSYTSDSDRSRSPHYRHSRSRSNSRTRSRPRRSSHHRPNQNNSNNFVDRNVSQPAVEERRIVYVGRIEEETTKDMLRRKFLQYGTIKQISIHYKDTGMKYGFVTFERSQDAFAAIDNSTRDPQINMYDVSFGGRRAFCRASYADLDNAGINTYESYVFPQPVQKPKEEDSFEALLMKMKAKLNANKGNTTTKNSDENDSNVQNNRSSKM